MNGLSIFNHEGCRSGRCVFRESVVMRLSKRAIADQKNHEELRRRDEEVLQEAARLMDEQWRFGMGAAWEKLPNTDPDEFREAE